MFDGSVLANYSSNFREQPMPTDIIALRDSEVIVVPVEFIRERMPEQRSGAAPEFPAVAFRPGLQDDTRQLPHIILRPICAADRTISTHSGAGAAKRNRVVSQYIAASAPPVQRNAPKPTGRLIPAARLRMKECGRCDKCHRFFLRVYVNLRGIHHSSDL